MRLPFQVHKRRHANLAECDVRAIAIETRPALAPVVQGMVKSDRLRARCFHVDCLPWATELLDTLPGGVAEMCVTARVLQLGVPVVKRVVCVARSCLEF